MASYNLVYLYLDAWKKLSNYVFVFYSTYGKNKCLCESLRDSLYIWEIKKQLSCCLPSDNAKHLHWFLIWTHLETFSLCTSSLLIHRSLVDPASYVIAKVLFQATLTIGLSYLPLAMIALDALEYWSATLPVHILSPHYSSILPYLDNYLRTVDQGMHKLQ